MPRKHIVITGACQHNLKNVSLKIPQNALVVITGVSGSGKSSLAFDTLYAEGQRRYGESLSAYARQFLPMLPKPAVSSIEGLSPAIAIEQKTISRNPRSTVGTLTEIHDYLRILFARIGVPHSPTTGRPIQGQREEDILQHISAYPAQSSLTLLAPWIKHKKGTHGKDLTYLQSQGFEEARIDQTLTRLDNVPLLSPHAHHTVDIVIDAWHADTSEDGLFRLKESLRLALTWGKGVCHVICDQKEEVFSTLHGCPDTGFSLDEITPKLFSFNSPVGACVTCKGLGHQMIFDEKKIIPDETLPLVEAIAPWCGAWKSYYAQILAAWGKYYAIDIHQPVQALSSAQRAGLLYGSQDIIAMKIQDSGHTYRFSKPFEGVITGLERRWRKGDNTDPTPYQTYQKCQDCQGYRLNAQARCVKIQTLHLGQVLAYPIKDLIPWIKALPTHLSPFHTRIAHPLLKEISHRLSFLSQVGVSYLSLDRMAHTLSGGESQLIRLASQIGSGLQGVLYVLDEPSIGLHQRDTAQLLKTLHHLRDLGNTVIVVEHDEDIMRGADHIIDLGPKAGTLGGEIIASGPLSTLIHHKKSLTAQYLRKEIVLPSSQGKTSTQNLTLKGVSTHNLKHVDVSFPLGIFTTITGVSGSGKSSLVTETLVPALKAYFESKQTSGPTWSHVEDDSLRLQKFIEIDQNPIGRTPRSNPATYTGIFSPLRTWFSQLPEAKLRAYTPGHFSFNVKGGRCEACEGMGQTKVEMHFLPDMYVTCDICQGKRYNKDILSIHHRGKSIADVLDMTIEDGAIFFEAFPLLRDKLSSLISMGLGYITLGQSALTLSGGEAQRIKLSKELAKRTLHPHLYILVEPTTGLHFEDIKGLIHILHRLVNQGHTVCVVEHNLDVIKASDWVIDLGPDGGQNGGYIVDTGSPTHIAQRKLGPTGQELSRFLSRFSATDL